MNKIAHAVILTAALYVALTACSDDSDNSDASGPLETRVTAQHTRSMIDSLGSTSLQPAAAWRCAEGSEDPTVYFTNTWNMRDDLASRGIDVPTWDLEDRKTLPTGSSYGDVYDGFQLAKLKAGSDVQMRYHGELVPPFCYILVRGFFAQYQKAPG
jgi:hypothetical protein